MLFVGIIGDIYCKLSELFVRFVFHLNKYICGHTFRDPYNSEEGVEFPADKVRGSCELLDMGAGNSTPAFRYNSKCS